MKKTLLALSLVVMVLMFFVTANLYASTADDRIESSAKQTYVFKTFLKNDNIKVASSDGHVKLTGTVEEKSHLSLANDTVEGLPGVKSVDNQLTTKETDSSDSMDAWLITKVKFTLLFHKSVDTVGTNVTAENGIITLRGEADNLAQKKLTSEYAGDVDGVKSVNNMMTVSALSKDKSNNSSMIESVGDAVDDASITAMVKGTLLYNSSTSGLKTNVVTKDGVVTLKGKAKNNAEKDLAEKLANDVHGVKKVVNNITIN
ncbi:BON domain-containing protein [Desulfovibrio gilichinskyi]|uniref:Osmotically-inducible protein OsmY, contains BON domain n=1 Tax=Desulfovibrio gilichinskyi TaxID=1519643 RepID=A0A1X7EXT2_9BACT|nr:BON domain-containing protein [Desulfovibrio gilichinskyi]SMF41844.1 Osmotically-inducible protein OsmY, contains BON domain [Desulfovibrio gilichinskyi]